MGLRINTNVSAIAARDRLGKAQDRADHAIRALSSGSRIVNASDDAAGFAISENLRGHMEGLKQAQQNTQNAIGFIQVAEGGLSEQNNILVRLRELSVQSASDTVSDKEREFIDMEYQSLSSELDRIAKVTTFGSKHLLTGDTQEFRFQVGTNASEDNVIHYKLEADTQGDSLGISGTSVKDQGDAEDTMKNIDEALQKMAGVRANFGAIQSRLIHASDHLGVMYENVAAAKSRLTDSDVAYEAGELTQAQILTDVGVAVLAQANALPQRAAKLINAL